MAAVVIGGRIGPSLRLFSTMNPSTLLFILACMAFAAAFIVLMVRKSDAQLAADRELYWQHKIAVAKFSNK